MIFKIDNNKNIVYNEQKEMHTKTSPMGDGKNYGFAKL